MAEAKPAAKAAAKEKTTKKATKEVAEKPKAVKKTAPKKTEKPVKETKETKDGSTKESDTTEAQASIEGQEVDKAEKATAKAGKRSAKAIAEVEEKIAKEERKSKTSEETDEDKPKVIQKKVRSKLERKGKNFRKVAELIQKDKNYSLDEALGLAEKTSPVKFDATVEMHIRLGVDPRQADQNIRDTIVLPSGTGRSVRVAVYADVDGVAAAKKAGADVAGSDEFLQQLDKGEINFDTLIATPAMMPKLGKYARVLGPKGLMPNPKSGTVTTDVAKAVTEAKAGRVEYRVDSTGIVHLGIGKVSFGSKKLVDNGRAVLASLKNNKPTTLKGSYVKSIHVTTSMGPSISVDTSEAN